MRFSVFGPGPGFRQVPTAVLGQIGPKSSYFAFSCQLGSGQSKHKMQQSCGHPSWTACHLFFPFLDLQHQEIVFFCFWPGPGISPSARGPKWAKSPLNHRFRHVGVRPRKKKLFPRKLRKTIPDSVVTFFFDFTTPVALGPRKGPAGLACLLTCLLAC